MTSLCAEAYVLIVQNTWAIYRPKIVYVVINYEPSTYFREAYAKCVFIVRYIVVHFCVKI